MNTHMIVPDPMAWEAIKIIMQMRTTKLTDPKSEDASCLTCCATLRTLSTGVFASRLAVKSLN